MSQVLSYPCCKSTTTTVEKLHGQEISDKHRWLEDENSEDYHTFIREQNSLTDEYLRHYTETEALKKFVVDSGSYPSFGCPTILEGAYIFAEKSGGQNGHLLQARSIHDPNPSKLIDIHKLRSSLGTSKGESYESYKFSPDGSLVSLTFSESGGDQLYGRILRLSDQSLLPDEIRGILWSDLEWSPDGSSLYYTAKLSVLSNEQVDPEGSKLGVMLHRVGTDQKNDILIYQNLEKPGNYMTSGVAGSKLYCYEFNSQSNGMTLAYCEISDIINGRRGKQHFSWTYINKDEDVSYSYIDCAGEIIYLYFKHDELCPNGKVVSFTTSTLKLEDVIEESTDGVLIETKYALVNGSKIAVIRSFELEEIMDVYDIPTRKWHRIVDSQIGSYIHINGSKDSDEIFFQVKTIFNPAQTYYVNLNDDPPKPLVLHGGSKSASVLDESNFETSLVWYKSKDATKVPMYIITRRNSEGNAANPMLLYAYGSHGAIARPGYNEVFCVWLSHFPNAIIAIACCRGGGELGETWHQSGMREKKQNSIEDLIHATKWLHAHEYSSPSKTFLLGKSAGGLLVAAAMNQEPSLYRCVVPWVGIMDLLRFHKFGSASVWISEVGNPEIAEEFQWLLKYSPYHNISNAHYPAVLVLTAENDDRVTPLHSFKYTAELQRRLTVGEATGGPCLLKVIKDAGHGTSDSTIIKAEIASSILAFVAMNLGVTVQQTDHSLENGKKRRKLED